MAILVFMIAARPQLVRSVVPVQGIVARDPTGSSDYESAPRRATLSDLRTRRPALRREVGTAWHGPRRIGAQYRCGARFEQARCTSLLNSSSDVWSGLSRLIPRTS
jgi:hypothetical protein